MQARGRTRRVARIGYGITLAGCAIFVASLLMHLYYEPGHGLSGGYWFSYLSSLWKDSTGPASRAELLLWQFGGVGVVGILSAVGLVRSAVGRSMAWALASATASWFLTSVASFFWRSFGRFPAEGARWTLLGLAVAAAGSVVVVLSSRVRKTAADPGSHTDPPG